MSDPNRELLINRKPLRDRDQPLSSDVAEAIYRLVGDGSNLPLALTKINIIERLIDIAHEAKDGEQLVPIRAAKRAMHEGWLNRLSNTAVFQSGYKHYEGLDEYKHFPVVPVTDYFFNIIYGNNNHLADVLDKMTIHEVKNSLPKRPGRVSASEGGNDYLRNEDGNVAHYGELAGIVVFPRNSRALLLRSWLERRGNVAVGQIESATASIAHARPDTTTVETLKEKVDGLKSTVTKALPRPK